MPEVNSTFVKELKSNQTRLGDAGDRDGQAGEAEDLIDKNLPNKNYIALEKENRQLVDTISALRIKLEQATEVAREEGQRDLSIAANQISQLKGTVSALREELESAHRMTEIKVQETKATSEGEIVQLKMAITTLREQLDEQKVLFEEQVQQISKKARDEEKLLKEMIQEMRALLESKNA